MSPLKIRIAIVAFAMVAIGLTVFLVETVRNQSRLSGQIQVFPLPGNTKAQSLHVSAVETRFVYYNWGAARRVLQIVEPVRRGPREEDGIVLRKRYP